MQLKNYAVFLLFLFIPFFTQAQSTIKFTLIDAETNTDIVEIDDEGKILFNDIQNTALNIRLDPGDIEPRSTLLILDDGTRVIEQVEGRAPYALFGDIGGNYKSGNLGIGNYTLTAQLYDKGGARGEIIDSKTISFSIIEKINEPPTAILTASEVAGFAPLEITFSGEASSDDEGILEYQWSFGDGNTSNEQNTTHTYVEPGEYTATLTVLDTGSLTDSQDIRINVQPLPPPPIAMITADIVNGTVPLMVNFSNNPNEETEDDLTYFWDFGDGTTSTQQNPQHTFETVGTFTTHLTLQDIYGSTSQDSTIITVNEPVVEDVVLTGELKKWHRLTLAFNGPEVSELDDENPFLWYRHTVTFTSPSGVVFSVPGFFAADGNASETSAETGNKWHIRFTPNEVGVWTYTTSFRYGENSAVSDDPFSGIPVFFDGISGDFTITATDKEPNDNRSKGRLSYVDERYLQFEETKEYFLKAGTDSPENFLAFEDFDNTIASKNWAPHIQDWREGDPTWQGGKGRGILGAINYLASKGMNSFSFLTMNIRGDGKDVWPWRGNSNDLFVNQSEENQQNRTRYDVSKLEQWEILFEHGDNNGMFLHFKLQEIENDRILDSGDLGIERKLYMRELIARFGHHLALNWNLGEENMQTDQQRKDMANYIAGLDPYNHHIVIHTAPRGQDEVYVPLLGPENAFTGASVQSGVNNIHNDVRRWVEQAGQSGKPWAVSNDEQGGARKGVTADADFDGEKGIQPDNRIEVVRKVLWGTLMAGGYGVEYYFGYETGETDLTAQNFRSRETKWEDAKVALDFFQENLPFKEMNSMDGLITGNTNFCFAKEDEIYLLYLDNGREAVFDLTQVTGSFTVQWYDPLTGLEITQENSTSEVFGEQLNTLNSGIEGNREDLLALVKKNPEAPIAVANSNFNEEETRTLIQFDASGSSDDGEIVSYLWDFDNGQTSSEVNPLILFDQTGTYTIRLTVTDNDGWQGKDSIEITILGDEQNAPFTFISTDDNQDFLPISNNLEILIDSLEGRDLNIRFNGNEREISSVILSLDGPISSTIIENNAPYALFGDVGGVFKASNIQFVPGNYTLTAMTYNSRRATGELLETITVNFTILEELPNEAPIAIPTSDVTSGFAPLTVSFNADMSQDDKGIVQYSWDFDNQDTVTEINPSYTFDEPGIYNVILTVTDEDGLESTESIEIEAFENLPPLAEIDASAFEGIAPLQVNFDGAPSLDDFGIVAYEWQVNGTAFDMEEQTSYVFENAGLYEITLVVMDGGNLTDMRTIAINVLENQAPEAIISSTIVEGEALLTVQFNGESSSDDQGIATFLWDFNDGVTSTEINPLHEFQNAGTYTVSLTVTDTQGLEAIATTEIVVENPVTEELPPLQNEITSTSLTKESSPLDFYIGENSAKDIATLQFTKSPLPQTQIKVYSLQGKMVKNELVSNTFKNYKYTMEINGLPNGYYPVVVISPNGERLQQMMVVQNN